MRKRFLFTTLVVCIFFLLGLVAFLQSNKSKPLPLPRTLPTPTAQEQLKAAFLLNPTSSQSAVGKNLPVQIKLVGENLTLSGLSFRLISDSKKITEMKLPEKLTVNPKLIEAGWATPINKISIEPLTNQLVIEFAAINLRPEGFPVNGQETIATLDLTSFSPAQVNLDFDPQQAKILTKQNQSTKVNLSKGEYTFY